jgi:hypothetical protein
MKEVQKMNENSNLVYFGYEGELDYDYAPDYEIE